MGYRKLPRWEGLISILGLGIGPSNGTNCSLHLNLAVIHSERQLEIFTGGH